MTNEIVYCSRCQSRLFGQQFIEGTAFRVKDQISCEKCLGDVIAPLSVEEQQEILLQVNSIKDSQIIDEFPETAINEEEFFELDSTAGAPAATGGGDADFFELDVPGKKRARPAVAVTSQTQAREQSQNRAVIIFLTCLVGIAALGSGLYWSSQPERVGGSSEVRPTPIEPKVYTPSTTKTPGPTPGPAADPKAEAGKAALEKARAFAKANPDDLQGQADLFRQAAFATEGTSLGAEGRKEFEALQARNKELVARELAPVDKELNEAIQKEDFKKANELLAAARTKRSLGAWTAEVDARQLKLNDNVRTLFEPIKTKAVDAKTKKADADVKAATDRVAKWGLPSYVTMLDAALGIKAPTPVAPALAPPGDIALSEEAKAYQLRWIKAMELAGQRDYDGALIELDKAAVKAKESGVKSEILLDQDLLRKVQQLHKDAVQILSLWTRNEKVTLEVLDASFAPERIEDPFIRVDGDKVEVARNGAPVPIDLTELTARSLVNLLRKKKGDLGETEQRSAAVFCLSEGDSDAARVNYTGPTDQIPWKYWALAAKLAEKRTIGGEAGKKEVEARKIYYGAERDYLDVKSRAGAVQAFRDLLNAYADTAIVTRRRNQIVARRDGAKDYVFLNEDFEVAGTFKSAKQTKFGPCWSSDSDSDPSRGAYNYVNLKFYALPDTTYQCWYYIGGCCAEVFGCFYQASDLTFPNPKGGEVLKIEPGANVSLPVRHPLTFLKKTHAEHGGAKEPKRWDWAELKLPKYTEPGLKSVRILTDQKGFSVLFAVVSATRPNAPSESEMKSWVKKPELAGPGPDEAVAPPPVPVAVAEARDASLIGHWKLDDTAATALDSSGRDNSAVFVNEPSRVPGKSGSAVMFDGKERYINIPNSELLDRLQEGSYTVACWFMPSTKPGDGTDAAYALAVKGASHEGLTYTADQKFAMDHHLTGGAVATALSAGTFAPGAYYHVAGVVSKSEGTVRIYVNGRLEATASYAPGTAARDYKNETWKLGIAAPAGGEKRLSANGVLDDARLYNRALPQGDLRVLAGVAGGAPPQIVLTSPLPGEKFDPNGTVTISASITPSDRISKVEFYAGSTLLGTKTSTPYTLAWSKVAGGTYSITVRASDRSGAVFISAPLPIRVGNPVLYRAVNLGGPSVRVDSVDFEAKAKGVSTNGTVVTIKGDLTPTPDPVIAPLLKDAVCHNLGTSVSLIDIPNGTYQVFLYVVADGLPQVYDVILAGKVAQSRVQSGPAGTWQKLGPWTVDAQGGLLEIAAKGEASFAAIEIWRIAK